MSEGWIKLHRKILENPISGKANFLSLWVHVLVLATHKPLRRDFCGKMTTLTPGQFITGRGALSELTGIPPSTIERGLQWLESEHQIEQQKGNKGRIITVTNWEQYQATEHRSGQQMDNKWTSDGQQMDTNKKYKNIKNEKKKESTKESLLVFPAHLKFLAQVSWEDWLEYRAELKKPYKSIKSQQAQLNSRKWKTEKQFCAAIEYSIAQGYQGIFEDNSKNNGTRPQQLSKLEAKRQREKRTIEGMMTDDQRRDSNSIEVDFEHLG